jgi:hypothetical protein
MRIKLHPTGVQYTFTIRKNTWWVSYHDEHRGWFRFFGKGYSWKNSKYCRLNFSERNGYKKSVRVGNWLITKLDCYII